MLQSRPVLTLTLNPMIDKFLEVDYLRLGDATRGSQVTPIPGGKGINVSRQLRALGIPTVAMGFVGGEVGKHLLKLVEGEGISTDFTTISEETREGYTVIEKSGRRTQLFDPSPRVSASETEALFKQVLRRLPKAAALVCSGSAPEGMNLLRIRQLFVEAAKLGVPAYLDGYGEILRETLKARPFLVKLNREEFESTFGRKIRGERGFIRALQFLRQEGAGNAILTDGKKPVMAMIFQKILKLTPPPVRVVSAVGSGDSFLAGIIEQLLRGKSWEEAIRWGTALGSVNASLLTVSKVSKRAAQPLFNSKKMKLVMRPLLAEG